MPSAPLEGRKDLYGSERNVRFQNIKNVLTQSHVLQDGEYNYTSNKLNRDIWRTSNSTDFSGAGIDPSGVPGPKSQLSHHFEMGNMSGKSLDSDIFKRSTTQVDFLPNATKKPVYISQSRVINWPDMAPRFMKDRRVGPSEYTNSFIKNLRNRSAPNYPKVDTSKLQLPLDPDKFWKQRNTNFSLGCDDDGLISEQQRVYGRGERAYDLNNKENDATKVNTDLKESDKVSHVFRAGDYDNIAGSFVTSCNEDYGPRTVHPGEVALLKKIPVRGNGDGEEEEEDDWYGNVNKLQKYARENTVPAVFKDASDGRTYSENKHFNFGHDLESGHTIYAKDYALSAMVDRLPPNVRPTPSAGRLLQFDPNQSSFGVTSGSVDFQDTKYEQYRNSAGKTALDMNLEKRDANNVIFSFDLDRHTKDRQKSLNHSDFIGPPKDYRPQKLADRHDVYVDYLQTDDALPYPAPPKDTSEASHNFTGMSTKGNTASKRRTTSKKKARGRLEDNRCTHFIVGYNPYDFSSETSMKYRGEGKNDQEVPTAGKIEKENPNKMLHLSHSENTQDLKAADPFITNTRESIHSRMNHLRIDTEKPMTTSIMKKDYGPLGARSMTEAQIRVLDKYDKLAEKEWSGSHFFHTDNSGRNNFVSTAMDDFIRPDTMTGRKYLAAR